MGKTIRHNTDLNQSTKPAVSSRKRIETRERKFVIGELFTDAAITAYCTLNPSEVTETVTPDDAYYDYTNDYDRF